MATITPNICSIILYYCIQYPQCHLDSNCCDRCIQCDSHVHPDWRLGGYDLRTQSNHCSKHTPGINSKSSLRLCFSCCCPLQACRNWGKMYSVSAWIFWFTWKALLWSRKRSLKIHYIHTLMFTSTTIQKQRYPWIIWTAFPSSFCNLKCSAAWTTVVKSQLFGTQLNLQTHNNGSEKKLLCFLLTHIKQSSKYFSYWKFRKPVSHIMRKES